LVSVSFDVIVVCVVLAAMGDGGAEPLVGIEDECVMDRSLSDVLAVGPTAKERRSLV